MKNNPFKTAVSLLAIVSIIGGGVWVYNNRQLISDQFEAVLYQPSLAITRIEQKVALTENGKRIFYATNPTVDDSKAFNENCKRQEAGSPILGCYTPDDRIFIYNLTNEQLNGMEEVTAVHEMLHAVWQRMNQKERTGLENDLRAAYSKIDNKQLKERIAYYERTEPGEIANELHSILGTEISSLGQPLESYYEQFFNRQKVLELHQQYSTTYDTLYNRADELYVIMDTLSKRIESDSTSYNEQMKQLEQDIALFNSYAKSGAFTSAAQFNAERNALIARSNILEGTRQRINSDIAQFNSYNEEYQQIANQIQVLNDSMDSMKQLETAPRV